MTATSERLLTALETEITNVSKLEHALARTRVALREHATRLRLGEDAEVVMMSGSRAAPTTTDGRARSGASKSIESARSSNPARHGYEPCKGASPNCL